MIKKRLILTVLIILFSLALTTAFSSAEGTASVIDSGTTGALSWTLMETDTEIMLTISGTGSMPDYTKSSAPWADDRDNIRSVVIEDGVASIGSYAFSGCSNLKSITIPDSVTNVGEYAFIDCNSLEAVNINDISAWCGIKFGIPQAGCDNDDVKNYSTNPLAYAGALYVQGEIANDIEIPDNVTSIGPFAFFGCKSLTSIILSNNMTSIEGGTFDGCSNMSSVTIPDSVTSIGKAAFFGCSSLTSLDIPDGVTDIGSSAFSGCGGLTSITIPDGITSIEFNAFGGCSGLTSIIIPNSVTSIGESAFSRCSGLTSIIIPDSVKTLGTNAFFGCSSLTNITIPDSVTSLGGQVFSDCSSLKSITIPDSVTDGCIYQRTFYGCSSLTSVNLPSNVGLIEREAFYGCSSLKSITIPDSVTIIERDAFTECNNLVIHCNYGTAAHMYAKDNGIKYKLLTEDHSISKATVSGISSKVYTGKVIKQVPVVKLDGKTLSFGTSYLVSYENNTNVGTATMIFTGRGIYEGTIEKTFKINPRPTEIKSILKRSKGFTVKWKKRTLQNTGYQLQYATDKSFTKNEKTLTFKNNTTTSKKVTGLKGGKKYYYRVRCYKTVNGMKYWSKWTPRKYVITGK